jgi:maltooligosyltrehalose trehalohydrolase
VLGSHSFVLRYFAPDGMDRLLACNLGIDFALNPSPEPLLAPPSGHHWNVLWSSESPEYGGHGTPPLETEHNWRLPAHSVVLLHPLPDAGTEEARLAQRGGTGEPG